MSPGRTKGDCPAGYVVRQRRGGAISGCKICLFSGRPGRGQGNPRPG
ncbi:hypothetical protein DESPIG_02789 [Desulfovibrio piger ATCC 29098]|uniref:Uncharacterized protein n=1 Tax=Desulfovibrio piger ATCC 29098 TaxID=411464 RepID=B6WXG3_9BACT|nr:hypothetical protein DESPIG_02789 [Desulfovibrio piger ATCC 29098]